MKVLTASDLVVGDVVYWAEGGTWTRALTGALMMDDEEAIAALADAKTQETRVVNAYLVEMDQPGAPAKREAVRENIRARGPTIHPQFSRTGGGA